MDLLKSIIEEKSSALKASLEALPDQKKWIARKKLEEESQQKTLLALQEARRREKEAELKRLAELDAFLDGPKRRHDPQRSVGSPDELRAPKLSRTDASGDREKCDPSTGSEAALDATANEGVSAKSIPIEKAEVIRRLRKRGEVTTYFGETDLQRYQRLCNLEVAEHGDDIMEGQRNVFLQLLDDQPHTTRMLNDDGFHEQDEDAQYDMSHLPQESKERKLMAWIRKMLGIWEKELNARPEAERVSTTGKVHAAQFRQTSKDLKPLIKLLRKKKLETEILDKICDMVDLCEDRQYRAAHDKYIELSIGNAAWPMGVTMVGIHERAGRAKIFTSEIAHILNDETTRKYIHMIKRLISLAQRKFPTDPSKMVSLSSTHI